MKTSSLRILVTGMIAGTPGHGGATWAVLQFLLGLRRLGHDVCFVEPVENGAGFTPATMEYFRLVVDRFGLRDRAALLRSGEEDTLGLSYGELLRFAQGADLVLNLSGMLRDRRIMDPIALRVYVDLDPAFTQLWSEVEGIDMGFEGHDRYVTVGLSLGAPECSVPTCGRTWIPTLPPIVLEEWPRGNTIRHDAFTTVANWRGYGSVEYRGRLYGQKAHSLRGFLGLPSTAPADFLLALAIDPGETADRGALEAHGWKLVDPASAAGTPDLYRRFVRGSRAEFGIAKSGYVVSRSGWFSDRSACYLASGRPVLAQETGFSEHLPVGDGLLAFETEADALAGREEIRERYAFHSRAARELAESHLDSDLVLEELLSAVNASDGGRSSEVGSVPSDEVGAPPRGARARADVRVPSGSTEDGELIQVLEGLLRESRHGGAAVRDLVRRPSAYRTSYALDELDVTLADATRLELVLKDLAPAALSDEARRVKPDFLANPAREAAVYRTLLAPASVGPAFIGSVDDAEAVRHWLFLERVPGTELFQVGDCSVWKEVARWLARFHAAFREDARLDALAEGGMLIRRDTQFLRIWMDRARAFLGARPRGRSFERRLVDRLADHHEALARRIQESPSTLIHGEFYASNILVREEAGQVEVWPVDWEMAGIGSGLLDLAALVGGAWSEDDRQEFVLTYHAELEAAGWKGLDRPEAFLDSVACARLQLAIQWLGWAQDWTPPPEHVQDWAQEADALLNHLAG